MSDDGEFIEECIADLEHAERGKVFDEHLLRRPVTDLLPADPLVTEAQTSALEAVSMMQEARTGCVLVVRGGKLKGIFTERDVLTRIVGRGVDPAKVPVRKVMTADPETLRSTDSVAYALNKMSLGGYRHVPLVNKAGAPVGIVTVKDIIIYLVSFFSKSVLNLPTQPRGNYTREREGA